MGGVVLWRHDLDTRRAALLASLPARLEAQGFGRSQTIDHPDWEIIVFGKYGGTPPAVFTQDAQNFAACSGTFIYDGNLGPPALEAALTDFSVAGEIDWDKIYGSFCLLICREGQLWLIPDRLGVYPLYRDVDFTIISSSFLSLFETVAAPNPDVQSVYEYAFQGATYQDRSIVEEIKLLERGHRFRLGKTITVERSLKLPTPPQAFDDLPAHLATSRDLLRRAFAAFRQAFGDRFDTALSGGYDSRLVLALLRDAGVAARLHVYGPAHDEDVQIAQAIARGEGIPLAHIDKGSATLPQPDDFAGIVARNYRLFDGYPSDGIFDSGADADSRLNRAHGGALALNGGGGEIFRNFFYLPDRPLTIRDIVWSFFSQYDPGICTTRFNEHAYQHGMARAIADVLGLATPDDRLAKTTLARWQVEYLYPHLRCVYWMGRNNGVNNRLGFAATPFIEPALLDHALQIPIAIKNHGIYEAALIDVIDPALAAYPSAYGQSFDKPPSLKRRLKGWSTLLRPSWLRRISYRIQNRRAAMTRPRLLQPDYVARLIDPAFPVMSQFFQIAKVKSALEYNRICTLEYLFSRSSASKIDEPQISGGAAPEDQA